jgi:hypothetical protein
VLYPRPLHTEQLPEPKPEPEQSGQFITPEPLQLEQIITPLPLQLKQAIDGIGGTVTPAGGPIR